MLYKLFVFKLIPISMIVISISCTDSKKNEQVSTTSSLKTTKIINKELESSIDNRKENETTEEITEVSSKIEEPKNNPSLPIEKLQKKSYSIQEIKLREELWNRVGNCAEYIFEVFQSDEEASVLEILDGKKQFTELLDNLVDDPKNGFVHISGAYPTCGCECDVTIGAFKGNDQSYTFLKNEKWTCEQSKKISANRPLADILPSEITLENFLTPNIERPDSLNQAYFYLDIEIPQKGTLTKATLTPIPFGIRIKNETGIVYSYGTSGEYGVDFQYLSKTSSIIKKISNSDTLKLIAINQLDQLSKEELVHFGDEDIEKHQREIGHIFEAYSVWKQLKTTTVYLSWDRETNRFEISKWGKPNPPVDFLTFINNGEFLEARC